MGKSVQISIRLDQATAEKLSNMAVLTGHSKSDIVRELLSYESIHVHYGEKEILQRISQIYDDMNRGTLEMVDNVRRVNAVCDRLLTACDSGMPVTTLREVALQSKMIVESILQDHWRQKLDAEREVKRVVDFHYQG